LTSDFSDKAAKRGWLAGRRLEIGLEVPATNEPLQQTGLAEPNPASQRAKVAVALGQPEALARWQL